VLQRLLFTALHCTCHGNSALYVILLHSHAKQSAVLHCSFAVHLQVGDVMNRLTVAMPTPRDSRTREASIPESVVAAKAAAAASSSSAGGDDSADGDAPMGQVTRI
jgi:hypothetical protein